MKKMKIGATALAAMLLAVSLAGCGSAKDSAKELEGTATSSEGTGTVTIKATNYKFEPGTIKVKKGDKVKLTLSNKQGLHGLKLEDYNVELQEDGATAEFTADKAGTFEFHCSIMCGSGHDGMKGELVVEE
ncbi:cytochrome c oxidase subunit II [Paenibacillus alvei TS-15]|uniref:Cytochrome c oxidase subunit II n=1 Tax=Paenibacillus alvei TS-15 TaxID=1117108 RepID=S9SE90_PAEAL|nr:cupredoxin domain-containing protein [Paenibacillus alvei]EPY04182.1 cytochrome c oxidase subunit II [Paenibacillus alvei TS-15]